MKKIKFLTFIFFFFTIPTYAITYGDMVEAKSTFYCLQKNGEIKHWDGVTVWGRKKRVDVLSIKDDYGRHKGFLKLYEGGIYPLPKLSHYVLTHPKKIDACKVFWAKFKPFNSIWILGYVGHRIHKITTVAGLESSVRSEKKDVSMVTYWSVINSSQARREKGNIMLNLYKNVKDFAYTQCRYMQKKYFLYKMSQYGNNSSKSLPKGFTKIFNLDENCKKQKLSFLNGIKAYAALEEIK